MKRCNLLGAINVKMTVGKRLTRKSGCNLLGAINVKVTVGKRLTRKSEMSQNYFQIDKIYDFPGKQ